jgi:hypothetical protein
MGKILKYLHHYFYIRFKNIPTCEEAEKMNLTHFLNVYGDQINLFNCRSLWYCEYGFRYRCDEIKVKSKPISK